MTLSEKAPGRVIAGKNPTSVGRPPFLTRSGIADGRVDTDIDEWIEEAESPGADANRRISCHHNVAGLAAAVLIDVRNRARFAVSGPSRRFHGNSHHDRSGRDDHPGIVPDHDAHDRGECGHVGDVSCVREKSANLICANLCASVV